MWKSIYGRHIFSTWKINIEAKKENNSQKAKSGKRNVPI